MKLSGHATYFLEPDTNTDVIIPAKFLKRVETDGFEPFAFYEKRYLPATQCEASLAAKDFVFNKTVFNPAFPPNHPNGRKASFLVTWLNFGCGSSREHAVYSLRQYKVIIGGAPAGKNAFADIFRDNCRQNLIWTPVLSEIDHRKLCAYIQSRYEQSPVTLWLDSERACISNADQTLVLPYSLPAEHKQFLLTDEAAEQRVTRTLNAARSEVTAWRAAHAKTIARYPIARL